STRSSRCTSSASWPRSRRATKRRRCPRCASTTPRSTTPSGKPSVIWRTTKCANPDRHLWQDVPMKILVVGLGYVGRPLAARLAQGGHDVLGVRRGAGPEPAGVPVLRGDALSGELWQRLPSDFDQVVVLLWAGERGEAAYERTYLGGARSVRGAFPQARIVWVSSTAVYDADDDARIDDSTPASAAGGTAKILLRAEAALHPGPCLIVRPSGIYGPERTSLLRRLL